MRLSSINSSGLSVLISVYSKENPVYLDQSLSSVWNSQTLKPDEIVLVEDGCLSHGLDEVIKNWRLSLGEALVVIKLPVNVGLGAALNSGLKACNYDLVARMDADDISLPHRFEKQLAFMRQYPDVAASSATVEEWDESLTTKIGQRSLPNSPSALARFSKSRSPLNHPLVVFRKDAVLKVGGYPDFRKGQDYALWSLLLVNGFVLANIPEVLLKMRTGQELFSRRGLDHLRYEIALLNFQRKINFLSTWQFCFNLAVKSLLRLSPNYIKRFAYRYFR